MEKISKIDQMIRIKTIIKSLKNIKISYNNDCYDDTIKQIFSDKLVKLRNVQDEKILFNK